MKLVIAGGTGLIGQALTKELKNNGYEVVILSRNPEKYSEQFAHATVIYWDGTTTGDWVSQINGAIAVINLAGASIAGENLLRMRWTSKRKTQISESRINAGKALTEAIGSVEKKPSLLIQSSAVGIYGPLGDQIVDDTHLHGNDYLANVCKEWEASTKEVEEMGVRRVIIRTGLVFSQKGGIFTLLKLPYSFFVGGRLGSGKQYFSWIHIDDVVGAICHLMDNSEAMGTFNLTSPNPVNNREFNRLMGKAMAKPGLITVPSFAMRLVLGEVSTLALDGQRVVPQKLQESGYRFKFSNLSDALSDLLSTVRLFQHSFLVPKSKEKVAAFHRNTVVLKQLTPFPILVQFKEVEPVGEGTKAVFTLWFGPIPVHWEAVHHDFNLPDSFSDTQLKGPFEYWFHRHSFNAIDDNTTEVIDTIEAVYGNSLFMGIVSRLMWITLPILFAFRGWQTKRLVE
jgi:uncharacterized protein (TIGR01777 family)